MMRYAIAAIAILVNGCATLHETEDLINENLGPHAIVITGCNAIDSGLHASVVDKRVWLSYDEACGNRFLVLSPGLTVVTDNGKELRVVATKEGLAIEVK